MTAVLLILVALIVVLAVTLAITRADLIETRAERDEALGDIWDKSVDNYNLALDLDAANARIATIDAIRDDACIASSAARAKLAFAERTIVETQARIPDAVSQLEAAVGEARALFNRVLVETAP